MNMVAMVGRLVRDADLRYAKDGKGILRFTIAIDRVKDGADFPQCFMIGEGAGKIADYMKKGKLVSIEGSISTGKYEKDGTTVYTTEVFVDRVKFLGKKGD